MDLRAPSPQLGGRLPLWAQIPRIALVCLAFLLGCFEVSDYDIWWHLRTGELIPQNGVPQKDWYTFKSEDEAWIDVHWGFQIIAAGLHSAFGAPGLVVLKAALGAIAVGVALSAYRNRWPVGVHVAVWLPAIFLMSARFYERPEMFTLVFTAIYLAILFRAEERPRLLWLLPLTQAAWANVQGLFVFGPILLAMYWVEAVARESKVQGLFRHLMPVTLLVFAACLVSPYGIKNALLVWQISQTATSSAYRNTIAELKSVPALVEEGAYFNPYVWLLGSLMVMGTVSVLCAWRTVLGELRFFRVLPFAAFSYLGLQAVRNGNHFALVAGATCAWNFGSLRWNGGSTRRNSLGWLVAIGVCGWLVFTERWHLVASPQRKLGFGERSLYYAHDAMKLAGMPGMPRRAFIVHSGHAATYIYANYSPGADRKVFNDARLEVHSLRTYNLYLEIQNLLKRGDPKAGILLAQDQVQLIGADGEHNFDVQGALLADLDWVCIHFDPIYALFVRKDFPLPPAAAPVDLKAELFENPPPVADLPATPPSAPFWIWRPPENYDRGMEDLWATRAAFCASSYVQRSSHSPTIGRALCLRAIRGGIAAVARRPWHSDSYRNLGTAAFTVVSRPPPPHEAWRPERQLAAAFALRSMRQALELRGGDFSANYYSAQLYENLGAPDLALSLLDRLANSIPTSAQQIELVRRPERLAKQRNDLAAKIAERTPNAPVAADLPSALAALRAGLPGASLPRLEQWARTATELSDDGRAACDALLALGHGEQVARVLRAAGASAEPGWRDLRLGAALFIERQFAQARAAWESVPASSAERASADFCLAFLAAIHGDKEGLRRAVASGMKAKPDESIEQSLRELDALLQETKPSSAK